MPVVKVEVSLSCGCGKIVYRVTGYGKEKTVKQNGPELHALMHGRNGEQRNKPEARRRKKSI